ncbi:hypothetical protein DM860_012810 [Cuscuta australis]|uniref:Uncharacterized protein n=1 Tax=Cuscuta australis TaxID=267555 RepID=A0A328DUH4_9ASTE|nr:hypothetical protein DM860_012810 [Cuscuta australis]
MTSILKGIFPISSPKKYDEGDDDGEFDLEYSIAMEYSGPLVSHDIPQVVPVVLDRIPAATLFDASFISNSQILSIPVIRPIAKTKDHFNNKGIPKASSESTQTRGSLNSICGDEYASNKGYDCVESSGTLGFSDHRDHSNEISESSGALSSEEVEETTEIQSGDNVITSNSDDGVVNFPVKSLVVTTRSKKCFRCHKRSMFIKREVCLVCNAKYCDKCVVRAMGSMPEGRKCITCIGYGINERKRDLLGKSSAMLKRLFTGDEVKRVMTLEKSCKANQVPSKRVIVNGKCLSPQELVVLQSCPHPPKKLKPGRYWYDQVSGFWGKEGERPCQIISDQLPVGETIKRDASNGNTDVIINGREITGAELWMMKVIGIHCDRSVHFWLQADGTYQHEGMKNVMGNLWEKTGVNLACAIASLPTPPKPLRSSRQDIDQHIDNDRQDQTYLYKVLLVGCDRSGTSTIFKQAKIENDVRFEENERQCFKRVIQGNLYKYISILLEGRDQFEEGYRIIYRQKHIDEPGPSVIHEQEDEENIYSMNPRLKKFADWLLQVWMSGNLEAIFPAATREYSPWVEELWKDKAFQATYQRRFELHMLPRVAAHFLERAVEISRPDYDPSSMDILYAEGCASAANGVALVEFSLSKLSNDSHMTTIGQNNSSIRCELTRVPASSLGENCKFLEMFEDTDIVLYTVSLTDYIEDHEDHNGVVTNKMVESKKLFESIATHPSFAHKHFLLLLTKFDVLEELIEQFPLCKCEWFHDFNPIISRNSNNNGSNPSLAQRAFHYIASQFKATYKTLTGRKLYVSHVTGITGESVNDALKYACEILSWDEEEDLVLHEWAAENTEVSTSV